MSWSRFGAIISTLVVKRGLSFWDMCKIKVLPHDSVFTSFYRFHTVSTGTSFLGGYWCRSGSYMCFLLRTFGVYIGTSLLFLAGTSLFLGAFMGTLFLGASGLAFR